MTHPLAINAGQFAVFKSELRRAINLSSMESYCDTPDWIIAEYLAQCFEAFCMATYQREGYYGRIPQPVPPDQCPTCKVEPFPPKP